MDPAQQKLTMVDVASGEVYRELDLPVVPHARRGGQRVRVRARHARPAEAPLQELAGATVIGPILTGVPKPIQICSTGSTVNDILNMAAIAAGRVGQVK